MFRWARLQKTKEQPESQPRVSVAETQDVDKPSEDEIISALRSVNDPEIPVNIYDLGLIYGLEIGSDGGVDIQMTLTAPACPVAGAMPGMVETAVRRVGGVGEVRVELVWDPPWTQERMTEEAQLQLGLM